MLLRYLFTFDINSWDQEIINQESYLLNFLRFIKSFAFITTKKNKPYQSLSW